MSISVMIATWASAVAMIVAAVCAFLAWRSDRNGAAVTRVDIFIVALTTGAIALDRDRLTSWVIEQQDLARKKIGTQEHQPRGCGVPSEVRHGVFEILWLLQRSAGMVNDLKKVDASSQDVVLQHLSLVTEALNSFALQLSEDEIESFKESALTAGKSLSTLHDKFPTLSDKRKWTYKLSLGDDDEVPFSTGICRF
ncbi:MAG: hypothetical protein ACRDAX_03085 [Propionibacteriaceae bacterium]